MNLTIYNYVPRLWKYLSKKRRNQIIIALLLMIIGSIADLVSLASILPFLYLVTNDPNQLLRNSFINNFFQLFGFDRPQEIILVSTLFVALFALIAGIFKIFYTWFNARLAAAVGSDISQRIFRNILSQPYSYYMSFNTSKSIAAITEHININMKVINCYLQFWGSFFISILIVISILIFNWIIAISSILLFGLIYFLIIKIARSKVLKNGKKIAKYNISQVKIVNESFGFVRELIIYQLQNQVFKKY